MESLNVHAKIDELEAIARQQLETPDEVQEIVSYQFNINDDFAVRLTSEARNEAATNVADIYDHPRLLTKLLVMYRGVLSDRRPRSPAAFSFLYNHEEDMHGVQFVAPNELPQYGRPTSLGAFCLAEAEKVFYEAAVDLMHFTDHHSADEAKYSNPPVDNESLLNCSEEDFDKYDSWSDLHIFTIPRHLQRVDVVRHFLHSSNVLLAGGALLDQRSLTRPLLTGTGRLVPSRTVCIESSTLHGPEDRLSHRLLDEPSIRIILRGGAMEHVYERTREGLPEIKLQTADLAERYSVLQSFEPVHEEDGTVIVFNHSEYEWQERQRQERNLGMFVPTSNGVDFFLKALKSTAF